MQRVVALTDLRYWDFFASEAVARNPSRAVSPSIGTVASVGQRRFLGRRARARVIVDRHPAAEQPDDEEVGRDLVEAKALLDELT